MFRQKIVYTRYPIVYSTPNQKGGDPDQPTIDEFKQVVTACDLHKHQVNNNHDSCPLCIFTNAGESDKSNSCKPIDGIGGRCFQDATGAYTRMDLRKYLDGKSKITVENNIYLIEPDGEVCFGDTITTCLTYCLVLSDNSKIAVHLNPFTNYYARSPLLGGPHSDILTNEVVNIFNVIDKIKEMIIDGKTISKIYISGAMTYEIYNNYEDNNKPFIGDNTAADIGYAKNIKSIKQHLIDELGQLLDSNYEIKIMHNINIANNSIYFVNSIGNAVMQDKHGNNISSWKTL
jgi:hypothetical protein